MSPLFAFHGVDAKTGTTMVAQSVAEWIAKEHQSRKILLVSLSGKEGAEYVTHAGESIEGLKIFLENRLLSRREILQNCNLTDNLYFISGITDPGKARHFTPENAAYFLDCVKEDFDIIIADTGNDLDNGLAIGALEKTAERFLVLTQQETMLKRAETFRAFYSRLGIVFCRTIINKYSGEDPYDMDYIAKRLKISGTEMIRVGNSLFSRQAEMEYRTLLNYKDSEYRENIAAIAAVILERCGFEQTEAEKRRRKIWKPFTWMST